MNDPEARTPVKVCPNCSVASRTNAEICPSCGGRYGRRRLLPRGSGEWSWWLAIPVVVAAFALGFFGLSRLVGDDSDGEASGITLEQGAAVPDRISWSSLERHLGSREPILVRPGRGKDEECAYYPIVDQPDSAWEFCFEQGKLFSSAPIDEAGAGPPPESSAPAPGPPSGHSGGG